MHSTRNAEARPGLRVTVTHTVPPRTSRTPPMDYLFEDFVPKALYKDDPTLFRVACSGVILYVVVLLFSRLHGTRTTSKMNNFDWLISVASGSIFGSAVVSDTVTVMQAVVAFAVLMTCQWTLTKLSAYFPWFYHAVTASPACCSTTGGSWTTS